MKLPRWIGALIVTPVIAAASQADDSSSLLDALNSDDNQERIDALNVIATSAPASDAVLLRVIPHLAAYGPQERDAALRVFEQVGPGARSVLPELVALGIEARLQHRFSEVDAAIRAVAGRTGPCILWEMEDYCEPSSDRNPSLLDEPHTASLKIPDWIGKRPPVRDNLELFDVRLKRLLADLSHENPDVRWTALRGLELALEQDEFTQLTALSALDPDPRVRGRVMDGLWRAGEDGQHAGALAYALFHRLSVTHIRDQLARGSAEDFLFMQIVEVLADVPDRTVWLGLSQYYGTFDNPAPRQIRFLTAALGEADPAIRLASERIITRQHWSYQGVVQTVRGWLEDPDPETRARGLRAARHLGDHMRPFVPRLTELATGSESTVERRSALRSLAYERAPFTNLVRTVQARLLTDIDDGERAECIRTLGAWGEAAAPAIPALFEFVNDRSLRHDAVGALQRIHPPDHPMQTVLERMDEGFLIQETAESLQQIIDEQKSIREATLELQIHELEALEVGTPMSGPEP